MKTKVLVLTLMLFAIVCTTALANETTSKEYYDEPGAAHLVIGDYVRVRSHPTTRGYIICELRKGSWVKAFKYSGDPYRDETGREWLYVAMSDGHVGWVCKEFLSLRC